MKKKIFSLLLVVFMLVSSLAVLTSCGGEDDPCAKGHTDENTDWVCDVCEKKISHTCVDIDEDGLCDKCFAEVAGPGEEPFGPVAWEGQAPIELIYKMTDFDSKGSVPSGCRRYLAGQDENFSDSIDDAVAIRNDDAGRLANVHVTYQYYENVSANGWGKTFQQMFDEVDSGDPNTPDIFTNYTYDMVITSLKGTFHNLNNTKLSGGNYFSFLKDGYDEEENNRGYMYSYMKTLSLSDEKMYVLASDYFIDCVRAFIVVPVHIGLLETVGMEITGDLDGDGEFTVYDFYDDVRAKGWTYNKVAAYSTAVYKNTGTAVSGEDIKDRLGFVVTPAQSGSSLIYTSSATVIQKVWDGTQGKYVYSYPNEGSKLYTLFDSVRNLMNATGVTCISDGDPGVDEFGSDVDDAVSTRFCQGGILFSVPDQLSSLEQDKFQTLKENEGFGIVPVPLYHEIPEGSSENYQTLIHNCARPAGIARSSTKFAACTAFLDYQSTHSTHILDEYYDYKLQYDIVDGEIEGNVEMLQYLRKNVRTALDKTWEDTLARHFGTADHKLSMKLEANRFIYDLRTDYNEITATKNKQIEEICKLYETLP